jgi:hypothetical protein
MASNARPFASAEIFLEQLRRQLKWLRLVEDFENINRLKPVRLNVAGSAKPKKKTQTGGIDTCCVSVPTPAELDYQQNGIILPQKAQNLEKLLTDYEKTGKFDYELCYLLRKQEAQEDLKQWIGKVIQKRRVGDDDFGKEVDPMRFNDLAESVKQRAAGKPLFREAFERSLQESSLV